MSEEEKPAPGVEPVDDPKSAYMNLRTCICGEDASEHTAIGCSGGFDPDWRDVRSWLERLAHPPTDTGAREAAVAWIDQHGLDRLRSASGEEHGATVWPSESMTYSVALYREPLGAKAALEDCVSALRSLRDSGPGLIAQHGDALDHALRVLAALTPETPSQEK